MKKCLNLDWKRTVEKQRFLKVITAADDDAKEGAGLQEELAEAKAVIEANFKLISRA